METNSLPREAALIVNVHSRKGEALFAQAKEKLEQAGVRLIAAHAVHDPDRLQDAVRGAVASGAPMVIVGGGDGSLSGTVDELVGKKCVFGVLPLGTANSFARTLGIPLDLDGAVKVIASGRRQRIDLGLIDHDYFVNAASLGLSPMIGRTVPHKLKRYLGRVGYLIWAVKCSVGFRAFQLMIDDGRTQQRMWSTEVRILNGSYHGGVELSERADVQSGELVIQAVVGRSHARLAWDSSSCATGMRRRRSFAAGLSGSRHGPGSGFRSTEKCWPGRRLPLRSRRERLMWLCLSDALRHPSERWDLSRSGRRSQCSLG
jgi:diacylglycerol kinase family enzyme